MSLGFDLAHVTSIEFGACYDSAGAPDFYFVPVDGRVQGVLFEMVLETWRLLQENGERVGYSPSEKYGSSEYAFIETAHEYAQLLKDLLETDNLTPNTDILNHPDGMIFYFVRLVDSVNRRLVALRRASQFKGVLKSSLISWLDNSLRIIDDNVFRLDSSFDMLVDASFVHILRPSSFEIICKLQQEIMNSVPNNVAAMRSEMSYVDFESILNYASTRPRAARYIASILKSGRLGEIDREFLRTLCGEVGVEISETDGTISVQEAEAMGFLEVLDRRRYSILLAPGNSEQYRASGRTRLASRRPAEPRQVESEPRVSSSVDR